MDRIAANLFAPLAFLGRHGTVAIACSLLLGMLLPFLSAGLRPYLDETVLVLLTLAFLRIGFDKLGQEMARPLPIIIATLLALLVLPGLVLGLGKVTGFNTSHSELYLAFFIALVVPPITSVPVFAGLLRLPGAIALAFLILAMVATPFAATLHAKLFFTPQQLPFDGLVIGLRLAGFLVGASFFAFVIQILVGHQRIEAARTHMDGLNVLAMFVFAIATMDGVGPALIANPGLVLAILIATFALAFGQMAFMRLSLFFIAKEKANAIALATGLRNMGLMVAALGLSIPQTTWLWFAIGQFPIFFMPWLVELFGNRKASSREEA